MTIKPPSNLDFSFLLPDFGTSEVLSPEKQKTNEVAKKHLTSPLPAPRIPLSELNSNCLLPDFSTLNPLFPEEQKTNEAAVSILRKSPPPGPKFFKRRAKRDPVAPFILKAIHMPRPGNELRIGQGSQHEVYKTEDKDFLKKIPRVDQLHKLGDCFMHNVKNTILQYVECIENGIPVATYKNLNKFLVDDCFNRLREIKNENERNRKILSYVQKNFTDGCYYVKNIPHSLPALKISSSFIPPTDVNDPWVQLKEIIRKAYKGRIALDLQPNNVGLDRDGYLIIRDLMEYDEEPRNNNNPFLTLLPKSLTAMTKIQESQLSLSKKEKDQFLLEFGKWLAPEEVREYITFDGLGFLFKDEIKDQLSKLHFLA